MKKGELKPTMLIFAAAALLLVVVIASQPTTTGLVTAPMAESPSEDNEIPPMPCLAEHGCLGEYCCFNGGFVPRNELTEEQIQEILANAYKQGVDAK